mgnify:CR=1 FL=1
MTAGAGPDDAELAARISSYELAARMQLSVPDAANLKAEPAHIRKLYGADSANKNKAAFANNCILARRLVERGVRYVNIYHASWDHHSNLDDELSFNCRMADQPVAALLKDLKQRGLLEKTLIVWGGEFGRQPTAEYAKGTGRDHNSYGFTLWLAGGGIQGGISYGATDEWSWRAVDKPTNNYDVHATILHALGLEQEKLTFRHNGRDEIPTFVSSEIVHEVFA